MYNILQNSFALGVLSSTSIIIAILANKIRTKTYQNGDQSPYRTYLQNVMHINYSELQAVRNLEFDSVLRDELLSEI